MYLSLSTGRLEWCVCVNRCVAFSLAHSLSLASFLSELQVGSSFYVKMQTHQEEEKERKMRTRDEEEEERKTLMVICSRDQKYRITKFSYMVQIHSNNYTSADDDAFSAEQEQPEGQIHRTRWNRSKKKRRNRDMKRHT